MRRKRTSVNAIFSFKRRRGRRKKTTFPLKSISLTMFCFINNNIRGSNHRKRRAREKNPRHCIGINFHRLFENDVFLSRLNSVLLWLWSICNCMLNVCHRLTCTTINKKKKKKTSKGVREILTTLIMNRTSSLSLLVVFLLPWYILFGIGDTNTTTRRN